MTDNDPDDQSSVDLEDERIVSARNPELARKMEEMRQEILRARNRAHQADDLAKKAFEKVREQQETIERLKADNEELHDMVDELREDQSMLQHVATAADLSPDERAIALLQTLFGDARSSDSNKTRMTAREAWNTLSREVPRSRAYDALKRAETLVDDEDICWWKKEPRGHQPPSRLIVDLDGGEFPDEIHGKPMKRGCRR